ncbi:MAG TPA: Spy/CpxP family protein refolding chaperone [Vicinamibacterales bacterium]|nr:Spy/CpxP family protein refolding chaperone [Vicinamibacterales bacterium]
MGKRGRVLLPVVLVLMLAPTGTATTGAAAPVQQDARRGTKWWKDSPFRQELGLTDEQSDRIEAIFQSALPELRTLYDANHREEGELKKLIDANQPESVVSVQIDKTEHAHCAFNKARTLMLYRMRMVLSPAQRANFRKVHEDWEREQRKANGGGHR